MAKEQSVLDRYPDYRMDIGIEVHVQLTTQSKVFSTASNAQIETPNTHINEICAGYPGVLPVLNNKVVEFAVMAGLALKCDISRISMFDRKHYFYPDLPKGYQITQNDFPICRNGEDGSTKDIRINRIHIEEDAGKNIHSDMTDESFVDLNRAGTPLLEIVSEPDICNAQEAKAYLQALREIVQYLGICSGNMEEGAFRADTNISVRKRTSETLGTRCELKNINSFKFISDAIEYEVERHIEHIEAGGKITQETRLWDSKLRVSKSMRSKENLADYRYFEDPDLALVEVQEEVIGRIKAYMPELPYEKFDRYVKLLNVSPYEADILTSDKKIALYFEQAMELYNARSTVNWLLRDVLGCVKDKKIEIDQCLVTPQKLTSLVRLLDENVINNKAAKEVFDLIADQDGDPLQIVESKGLKQIGSSDELVAIVEKVLDENSHLIADYKAGKQNVFGFFVGACMKASQGKGNPKIIQDILKKLL